MKVNVELLDLYKTNDKFKKYVDKYAKTHNRLFPEDCFFDSVVVSYADYVREKENE